MVRKKGGYNVLLNFIPFLKSIIKRLSFVLKHIFPFTDDSSQNMCTTTNIRAFRNVSIIIGNLVTWQTTTTYFCLSFFRVIVTFFHFAQIYRVKLSDWFYWIHRSNRAWISETLNCFPNKPIMNQKQLYTCICKMKLT